MAKDMSNAPEGATAGALDQAPRLIITRHVYPPIPVRASDWCAYYDGEEELGNYGWGATEQEAINDLMEMSDD